MTGKAAAGDAPGSGKPGDRDRDWEEIFRALDAWREDYLAREGAEDTVVTALARDEKRARQEPARRGNEAGGADLGWTVLVSTILSLRTKDDVTRERSRALLAQAPGPRELLRLGEEATARLAYPAGFYRVKAANLHKIARILLDQYGGAVPADMDALLALPGVGRKTANLVLTEAFDLDGLCVDTHVHRISNRTGWVTTPDPDKTEAALRELLPRPYWKRINSLLVLYGQQVCRPISPYCSRCVLRDCPRRGVEKSR